MMAGNPSNWWSMLPPSLPSQYVLGSSSLPLSSMAEHHHHNPEPNSQSWSQLLLGGLPEDDEDGLVLNNNFQAKKIENLEGRILIPFPRFPVGDVLLKQEVSKNSNSLSFSREEELQTRTTTTSSSSPSPRSSSVTSCLSRNSILDFSYNKLDPKDHSHDYNHSSECASTATTGGVSKKARVQPTSGQPPLKVRKEKVGDRITALHQLVSPFGKTDTASVLSEAIGYVRFLQGQIEALISPYLGSSSKTMKRDQFVQGERRSCIFPEDSDQLLNDNGLKRKLAPYQESEDEPKELRSRGLCLVPVSCTQLVQSDINGADYWAQAYSGSF